MYVAFTSMYVQLNVASTQESCNLGILGYSNIAYLGCPTPNIQGLDPKFQGLPPYAADPGPKIGPRALLGPIFFWIFWVARGASLTNLGHFTKFRPGPNFQLFLERFSLITHLPPDHGGANPCKKDAGHLQEPTKTLPKTFPWGPKSKSS